MLLDFIVACGDCGHIAEEHADGGHLFAECCVTSCDCSGYVADEDDYQRIATEGCHSNRLTLEQAEELVGEPATAWTARCFEIASALAPHVNGTAVYGAWDGPVAPGSHFDGHPSPNHGWILLDNGEVLDPTRWVFEGLQPYLYEGGDDYYDEGRNRFRAERMGNCPAGDGPSVTLELSDALAATLTELCGTDTTEGLTAAAWMWAANLPYDTLNGHNAELYAALTGADMAGFIPIDNRLRAERDTAATTAP